MTPSAGVPCSNAAKIRERKNWTQSEFCTWQNSVMGQEPPKMYMWCTSPGNGQTCKVWLASVERRRYSNAAKTRKPLKLAGVPHTTGPISAASGPKFNILWGHVEEVLLFKFFFRLSIHALEANPDKVVRWCPDGKFLTIFCSEPRAARFRPAS